MLTPQEISHYRFIQSTDHKSIYKQIKRLVKCAEEVASKELNQRRALLQKKLEQEDEIYQEEFAIQVKSRIDRHIKKRKEDLLKIKDERKRRDQVFLEQKEAKRQLDNCFEVREALTRKEHLEVKATQLEQITEKERAFMRHRQLDEYWRKVRDIGLQRYDQFQALETKLKRDTQRKACLIWDEQIAMHRREYELECELKRQEALERAKAYKEMNLEQRKKLPMGQRPEMLTYRKELLDMIAEKKAHREAEALERAEEHRQLMRQIAIEEREDSAALLQRKRAVYQATMEYIKYVREMHKLEEMTQEMRDAQIEDLRHVDICTRDAMKRELKRKAEMATLYYAELRRQMCEEYERRLRETQEQREQKMIENRFARPEKSRSELMAEKQIMRKELEKQLAENERLRTEDEAKYNINMQQLSEDRDLCKQLAENYIHEQKDYLPVHPNWWIYGCPQKDYVAKCANKNTKCENKANKSQTCLKTCGCNERWRNTCAEHSYMAELKRGLNAQDKLYELQTC